jgi:NNP family nitrate/nitrite transporter-like MFS transporter
MAMVNEDRGGQSDPGKGIALRYWDPENEAFWSGAGKRIATRNLWISIPNLLCGFAVWLYWSIIIVQMQNLHVLGFFPFAEDKSLLYTLPAIAGLAGATLRIPNSFMIAISGGRNVIFVTSLLLIAPSLGVGSHPRCRTSASSSPSECRGRRWGSTPDWATSGSA